MQEVGADYKPLFVENLNDDRFSGCDNIWASIFFEIINKDFGVYLPSLGNRKQFTSQREKIGELISRILDENNTKSRSKQRHLDRY